MVVRYWEGRKGERRKVVMEEGESEEEMAQCSVDGDGIVRVGWQGWVSGGVDEGMVTGK